MFSGVARVALRIVFISIERLSALRVTPGEARGAERRAWRRPNNYVSDGKQFLFLNFADPIDLLDLLVG